MWTYIQELSELNEYFPDYPKGELPEREFMWIVLYTLRPDATKFLIKEARDHRSVSSEQNSENLIEIAPQFLAELKHISTKKSK